MTTAYTRTDLEAVEPRSVALHAARHPLEGQPFTPCPRCDGRNYGGVNLGLSNVCQSGHHDLCAGQVVVTAPGAPWSCGCLCHHARDRSRGE
jgi:hypothetical protein